MFDWFHKRRSEDRQAEAIYDAVVTAARNPDFYRAHAVPDTLSGRYEMLALHLFLVIERLRSEGREGAVLSRAVTERFVVDMDDCMREIGVGDMSVPKKVKSAAAGLFERVTAYRQALGEPEPALAAAIAHHVFPEAEAPPLSGEAMARYVRGNLAGLDDQPLATLVEGPRFATRPGRTEGNSP